MAQSAQLNFVRQQGLAEAGTEDGPSRFSAFMFQPKIIAAIVIPGLIFQPWLLFAGLAAVLWWNVAVPSLNPFDALYNRLIAIPKSRPVLGPAPAPRRFAQGMAGTFMSAVAIFLCLGWRPAAYVAEAMVVVALSALIFGKLCLGSYIYHLLRGQAAFANRTLPWTRST
jgi:hypothetical protein